MTEQKAEISEKSIIKLQAEIEVYKRKERVYMVELAKKEKTIKELNNLKKYLTSNLEEISEYESDKINKNLYVNPIMLEHFNLLQNSLNEIEDANLRRDEEMIYLEPQSNQSKKFYKLLGRLVKDNGEIFQYINGNYIENMKQDNDCEKGQIDQLLFELKDRQNIFYDLQQQIDQACETKEFLKRKIKAKKIIEESEKNNKKPKN